MPFRLYMGLKRTRRDKSHRLRHPAQAAVHAKHDHLDLRSRGNDVALHGPQRMSF